MTVHVITASKHESSRAIGEAIAQRLRDRGENTVAEEAEAAPAIGANDPVVLGSPIYMGKWRKDARQILDRLGEEPAGRAVWLYTVGPLGDPPKPEDAKPEEEVESFAADRARGHRLFTGKLDRSQLNRRERLAIRAVKAPEGDFRDWAAIDAWADEIADALAKDRAGNGQADPHAAG
jgi:menaquinone-dependent protoporphyrinogen oxidase